MLRRTMIALLAVAAFGMGLPAAALARDHHGGWRGGYGWGLGYGPWGYDPFYPPYYDGNPHPHGNGCYEVRQRVLKPYGWAVRRISICE